MNKLLDRLLEFVFRKESAYVEAVSGILLLALAIQARPYVHSAGVSTAMLIGVGALQLASLALFKCNKCYATRTLTASAGAFAWLTVAAHQFKITDHVIGASIAPTAGSIVMSFTMMLAAINILKTRNSANS